MHDESDTSVPLVSSTFAEYQNILLVLFLLAQLFAFFFCVLHFLSGFIKLGSCEECLYDAAALLAASLCTVGCIIFYIVTRRTQENSYSPAQVETTRNESDLISSTTTSISFWLMVVGTVFYTVVAAICVVLHKSCKKNARILPEPFYEADGQKGARKITFDASSERRRFDYDDDGFSMPSVRKLTPHPRSCSIITTD
ncbi:unnamed protein product [Anisakis simplex]|uniref:Transmembrane protein n=1 Tax=Anisakis simplex TaxID=6269 RepID=A0A0M3K2G9_ANISI|nr:unnamed protein product [Anisakis simplex]